MKKGILMLIVFFVSVIGSFGFVAATVSSGTNTTFYLPGCENVPGQTGGLGEYGCSLDGKWFCNPNLPEDSRLSDTLSVDYACNNNTVSPLLAPEDVCCPNGYKCDIGGSNVCVEVDCSNIVNPNECLNSLCWWDGSSNTCFDRGEDLACSFYKNMGDCKNDIFGFGQRGLGTENCGKSLTSNGEYGTLNCACKWNNTVCELYSEISPLICPSGNCGTKARYNCYKLFDIGPCVDGNQLVSWTAEIRDKYGNVVSTGTTSEACSDGSRTINCGADLVKLPGFSFFALVSSVIVIAVVYFIRKDLD